jgi:hypothetical protein
VDFLVLLVSAGAVSLAAVQDDGRALAEQAGVLMDCTVAAGAAQEDAETEITLAPEVERAAYDEARRLLGLAARELRQAMSQADGAPAPRDAFFLSQSEDLTAGFLLGQAHAFALRDVNDDALDMADLDPELYASFFDARPWAGYHIYTDNDCAAVLGALVTE